MKVQYRSDILIAPLFIAGLFCLLINDLFLKYEFSNALTGKLSDFAGLFIFPFFFSAYWPKQANLFYRATAALFIVWKLPLAQGFIDLMNSLGIGINRVVDYSDFWALLMLPLSFIYFNYRLSKHLYSSKPFIMMLSVISIFSFCATTVGGKTVEANVDTNSTFIIDMSKWKLLNTLPSEPLPGGSYHYPIQEYLTDSLYYLYFHIPEIDAEVTAFAVITAADSNKTVVHLDRILSGIVSGNQTQIKKFKALEATYFENSFRTLLMKQLETDSIGEPIRFHNKRILDNYENSL